MDLGKNPPPGTTSSERLEPRALDHEHPIHQRPPAQSPQTSRAPDREHPLRQRPPLQSSQISRDQDDEHRTQPKTAKSQTMSLWALRSGDHEHILPGPHSRHQRRPLATYQNHDRCQTSPPKNRAMATTRPPTPTRNGPSLEERTSGINVQLAPTYAHLPPGCKHVKLKGQSGRLQVFARGWTHEPVRHDGQHHRKITMARTRLP